MIEIRRGASYEREIEVEGSPPAGATTHYRIARGAGSTPLLSVEDADITVDAGTYTVPIGYAETAGLPVGKLYEELYEIADGVRNVLYSGTVQVRHALVSRHDE